MRSFCASILAAVGLFAGCAGAPGTPEATLEAFFHALGRKDVATACDLMAYNGTPLAGSDVTLCRNGLDSGLAVVPRVELEALRNARVSGAVVSGRTATVNPDQISGVPESLRIQTTLVQVGQKWFIDSPRER